ncbi:TetR/AcrR family transcriptional regulator [Streptomyces sp. NPDC059582]|uniref:TetR/AcrR family transcriptional regulator n=1 Tax=Streptomyces sp. NPDC059582 TaxID=3346875 RepID=UPI0036B83C1E
MRHEQDPSERCFSAPTPAPPRKERADAARNRAAILEAAARLFDEHGADGPSMGQVAAAAGVGKGTLFRRFGDRSGLATALLTVREQALREAILHGPPPLGPGAPACERLVAFFDAYVDHLIQHLDLVRTSETSTAGARYRAQAYLFWHRHVTTLLHAVPDPRAAAHTLLATLSAEHVSALLPELGEHRLRACLTRQARIALHEPGNRTSPKVYGQWPA